MLDVILDYGRRFPDTKFKDLGLDFTVEMLERKIRELFRDEDYLILHVTIYTIYYSFYLGSKGLQFSNKECEWEPVPQHIILRFITEGKEDLI